MASVQKTPEQMVARWKQGMQQGGTAWYAAIESTSKNPMALAAQKGDKAMLNYSNAISSGRWAQRLNATSVAYWKEQCKGAIQKFAMGAQKGAFKYGRFAQQAAPVYKAMKNASMGAGDDPIAKATAALQVLLAAGRKQGGNAFV